MNSNRPYFNIANPGHVFNLLAEYQAMQLQEPDLVSEWQLTLRNHELDVINSYERAVDRFREELAGEMQRMKN